MTKFVIFDLDNCLYDDRHRIPLIDWSKKGLARWAEYHGACDNDLPAADSFDLVQSHINKGEIPVFITGRPELHRYRTSERIMRDLTGSAVFYLLMRPNDDEHPSAKLKDLLLTQFLDMRRKRHFTESTEFVCAYDDRHDVLQMYKDRGIPIVHRQLHSMDAYAPPRQAHPVDPTCECAVCDKERAEWPRQGERPVRTPTGKLKQSGADQALAKAVARDADAVIRFTTDGVERLRLPSPVPDQTAADILSAAAATFRERNAVYGSNYLMIRQLMDVLFPAGVPTALVHTDRWHLFELMLVKLSRFAISGLTHQDSIRDLTVYGAMVEAALPKEDKQ